MPLAPAGRVCDGLGAVCCVGSSTFVGVRTASVSVLRTVSMRRGHGTLTWPKREMETLPRCLCRRRAARSAATARSGISGKGVASSDSNARRSLSCSSLRKI